MASLFWHWWVTRWDGLWLLGLFVLPYDYFVLFPRWIKASGLQGGAP